MNRGVHRVVWNAARGLRMAVAETARGMGKGAVRATVGATAVLALLAAPAVQAQIAANPFAAASQRPQVLMAPNGVPLVNITTPSPAGVSVNQYQQFDVNAAGAILNNSRTTAQTQLGGLVQGNPWLATGPARLIVNQVSSANPSHLDGTIEVAGQRAEVVIANPSGISVNGAGFINASQVTLTTGVPQYGALGNLDAFLVQGGTIRIEGAGLDAGSTDYAAILSRALQVNAALYANELKVATGANRISADHGQVTPTAGSGAAPTFALDVAALGGMYARKITLIGTEAGLGVRNAGRIGAGAGGLVVTAAGRLENTGTLEGQSVRLSSGSEIDNRGGTIRQGSAASLDIGAPTLSNTDGGWIGAEPIATGGTSAGTGGTGTTGTTSSGTPSGAAPAGGSTGSTAAPAPAATPAAPPEPGVITAAGALLNDGGRIYAGGPIALHSPNIVNRGGTLSVGSLALNQASFSNQGGTLNVSGAFSAQVDRFDNSAGTVRAGSLDIASAGELVNTGGTLTSEGDARLSAGGGLNNTRGTITAAGAMRIEIADAIHNTGGTVASNGQTTIAAGSLANRSGAIRAAGASPLGITTAGLLDNRQGEIGAGGNATLAAGALDNDAGRITAAGDLLAHVVGAASNRAGTLAANGSTTLTAGRYDNKGGTTAAVDGDLTVTTGGATTNAGGTMQAGGATLLANAGLDNTQGRIFGERIGVDTHGQQFANAQGTLAATNAVDLQTGALVNDAGLIQSGGALTIDTHGQSLGNANAAGHASGQGGITSAGTLGIDAGAVNNAGGFIGAKGALTANTQDVSNTAGGLVLGQEAVSIHTNGGAYDNAGGQTQAVGDLTLTGAGVDNRAGLLRSGGTTTLAVGGGAVLNTGTQAADQGIEGRSVAITAGSLDNAQGAIRANEDLTATVGGVADNTGGLMSARGTLTITDPHAADPAARQLEVINTGGTLVADQGVVVDAARFSGDGTLASGGDLRLAVTQDLTNNAKVVANGDLSYGTTGQLTNNGQLLAGGTLTVSGSTVGNAASGEMSATDTTVTAAGTLTNRGLIDSVGTTRIDAGIVNNIGTGRIYGDSVAIGAGQVNNDAETVGGVASSATIAGRLSVDIGATEINNREHSLIFSGDAMRIGGALNAQGKATGQGAALNNLSADIESLGGMAISMGKVNNWDVHITKGLPQSTTTGPIVGIAIAGVGFFLADEVIYIPGQPYVWQKNPDGSQGPLLTSSGYGIWYTTFTTTADTAVDADPSRIVSGGDMALHGAVSNKNSRIVAGGTLTATGGGITNDSLTGTSKTDALALVFNHENEPQAPVISPGTPVTIDLGVYEVTQHANATAGYAMGSAGIGSTSLSAGGAGAAQGGHPAGTIVEVASNVPGVAAGTGSGAGAAGGSTPSIPMVVRTSAPTTAIPAASLFSVQAGAGRYLIETDPRFANYRQWLGSDYLLDHLGVDPDHLLKRLGDGFYEQKLIREQIAQLTGYRYLDGYTSDEAQYTALMDAGATFARQYGLKVGVALTAEQMAQLTSDIVWLVEQTVTLPDGSTRQVLVPQVYVRVRPGDIDGHGALLSAGKFQFDDKAANLVNTGTIAGRELVSINAAAVDNLNGRISGGKVGIQAQVDINNLGGTIDAREALSLRAGRDVNVRTTTGAGALGNVGIDRVAGLYVSGPGGTLSVDAGRDANLVGAQVVNAGSGATAIKAGNDVNLGTVTTTEASVAFGSDMRGAYIASTEVGTTLSAGGKVDIDAGHDVTIRAGNVQAGGDLNVKAGNDIQIEAGRERIDFSFDATERSSSLFSRSTTTTHGQASSDMALGSRLSGDNVNLSAGRDVVISGSDVAARGDASLSAGRHVHILAEGQSASADMQRNESSQGVMLRGNNVDLERERGMSASVSSSTWRGSTVTAGDGLSVNAGDTANVFASQLAAGGDLGIAAQEVNIYSGTNHSSASIGRSESGSGQLVGFYQRPGAGLGREGEVTNSRESSTLAEASLSGHSVSITASERDLSLGAAHISASGSVSLTADKGAINFDVVTTGEQVSQGRNEGDRAYQSAGTSGAQVTQANYTRIDSADVAIKAPTVNVQAGVGVAYQGTGSGPGFPVQTIAQVIASQAGQPGMQWLTQIQNDAQLNNLQMNWQGVELPQRQWAESQSGLTQAGAAVVAIVATVVTWGAASGVGGAAATSVGEGVALSGGGYFLTGTGAAISAGVAAGVSSIASQVAVSLINNNGNISAVLNDLGSSQSVRSILASMVSAGVGAAFPSSSGVTGIAANAVAGCVAGELTGQGCGQGAVTSGLIAALQAAGYYARQNQINSSSLFRGVVDENGNLLTNTSGSSVGVDGDSLKLGGNRINIDQLCGASGICVPADLNSSTVNGRWIDPSDGRVHLLPGISLDSVIASSGGLTPSPLGGLQGGMGSIEGIPYARESLLDRLVESFAGSHDLLNAIHYYDELGNNVTNRASEFWNVVNLIPSMPVGLATLVRQYPDVWQALVNAHSNRNRGQIG